MFKKNLIIAARSLKKDWAYAATNLVGLAIGITCCLLILSFVYYELSFDNFHTKRDRIYRVNYDVLMGGNQSISPSVPVFVGPELKKNFPEVEDATRFLPEWTARTIKHDDKLFDEKGFAYADPNFFKVMDYKVIMGDLSSALNSPDALVITKNIAIKYFGKTDAIGQTILFNNKKEYMVKAVIEDVPSNAHFSFTFLASLYSIPGIDSLEKQHYWNNPNYTTFLSLKPGVNLAAFSKKVEAWVNPPAETTKSDNATHLQFEPLKAAHFNTAVFNFKNLLVITDRKYINIFITVALLILLIACANYINLATAKASSRMKEVGVRKAIGASFSQLFFQFITESFLLVLVAVIVSVAAVNLLLPTLNNLLGKQIPFYVFDRTFLFFLVAGVIVIALLAGAYPALVLSRTKAVETLKAVSFKSASGGNTFRQSLVVTQFAISVALILGTIIVRSQLNYMQSEKLGLDKEHVVIINGNADISKNLPAFSAEIKKISAVQDVSQIWRSPFETVVGNGFSIKSNPTTDDDWHVVGGMAGDDHYLTTMGIALLAGRNFDPTKIKGDSTINEFIVNEAFLKHYRLSANEAIGKNVLLGMAGNGNIVGVMKDFHISSLHNAIEPVVMFNSPGYFGSVAVKVGPGDLHNSLDKIAKLWQSFAPARPFSYSFLDEEYDAMYRTEQRVSTLMSFFCTVAIIITCLGLLGLMTFIVAKRTKEIGIRKVLGASVVNIAAMLSKDFLKLVLIAVIIATPVAWYFMHQWLQDFAFRINVSWVLIVATAVVALLIALVTVSVQAIKAAVANPVKSLRTE